MGEVVKLEAELVYRAKSYEDAINFLRNPEEIVEIPRLPGLCDSGEVGGSFGEANFFTKTKCYLAFKEDMPDIHLIKYEEGWVADMAGRDEIKRANVYVISRGY